MMTGKCNDTRQVKTVGFSVSHVVDGSRRLFLFSTSHILPFSDFFEASTRAKKKEDKHVFRSHSERLVLLKPLNPPLLSALKMHYSIRKVTFSARSLRWYMLRWTFAFQSKRVEEFWVEILKWSWKQVWRSSKSPDQELLFGVKC